jgi:hypothetical protein
MRNKILMEIILQEYLYSVHQIFFVLFHGIFLRKNISVWERMKLTHQQNTIYAEDYDVLLEGV